MVSHAYRDDYSDYAKIYDALKGDRGGNVRLIQDLIYKHRPESHSLLELACGTASVAQGLSAIYTVTGLDHSRGMLKQAQKKLPAMQFIHADMTTFQLDQRFDVIYCLHNSVNHLLKFTQWEALFANVARHLNNKGLFIFDVNLADKMAVLVQTGRGDIPAGNHHMVAEVSRDARHPERYDWKMDIFVRRPWGSFAHKHTTVQVSTYPKAQIVRALAEHFTILDSFTLSEAQAQMSDDIGRTYFVCAAL